MTAPMPQSEDPRTTRIERIKPHHTGHHLSPQEQRSALWDPWWFADEGALERYEELKHRMFCRACATPAERGKGTLYRPLLVDMQPDPLDALEALCATHCVVCGDSQMYAVRKFWDINDEAVLHKHFYKHTKQYAEREYFQQQALAAQKMRNQQLSQTLPGIQQTQLSVFGQGSALNQVPSAPQPSNWYADTKKALGL